MDLKLIVNQPWEVLPSSSTPQASPTASTSAVASTSNPDPRDTDFRKPVLVPVKKLYLNTEQENAIRALYTENREYRMRFNTTDTSQDSAEQVLHTNGLSQVGQPQNKLENRWLTAWSSTWSSKKGFKKRSLFQWYVFLFSLVGSPNEGGTANSSSGYNTAARQARDKRGSQNPIEWSRQADYEFTGCLAHADVTWNRTSGQIERIIGYFEHDEKCEAATAIRSVSSEG
ncbi:hypothetical protein BDM02DRAFT_3125825 [Thelephora ganbajun]|uniref:Uncharacterized protein n=1 Tax=Thelephora ganbajun TaxID=370292 RepID=A0ACB6ZU92_THEGA|nr:hypothetical protein BDM02DRAFT_3125825 [Thelephora ganbajun]